MVLTVEEPQLPDRAAAGEERDRGTGLEWPQLSELDLGVCLAGGMRDRVDGPPGGAQAPGGPGRPRQPS